MKSPHEKLSLASRIGISILLLTLGAAYGLEVNSVFAVPQNWDVLLAPVGLATIAAYVLLLIAGLAALLFGLWSPGRLGALSLWLARWLPVRRLIAAALTLTAVWFYLYSPWQTVLPGPWARFLFMACLAQLLVLFAAPRRETSFAWGEALVTLALYLYIGIVLEVRSLSSIAWVYRAVTVAGYVLVVGLLIVLHGEVTTQLRDRLIGWRGRMPWVRWGLTAGLVLAPLIYRYSVGATFYITNPHLRFAVISAALWGAAVLSSNDSKRLLTPKSLGLSGGLILLVSALTGLLLYVVDYPFSLGWSEGNRLYDYSLIFGQSLYEYEGEIVNPYKSPGRYALWGVLYLLPELPIWVHRLWNILLRTIPPLILGWLLMRKMRADAHVRAMLTAWVALFFIVLAPVHPPIMIVAILTFWLLFDPSPLRRGMLLTAASLYAGLSRWTWLAAPGAWGALIDLLMYYPNRKGSWFTRLAPTVVLAALGILPGLLINLRSLFSYSTSGGITFEQPLLWYRLLPNPTYAPGILLSAALTTGPLLVLLGWWICSRRWQLDWLQKLAIGSVLTVFLAGGLIVSAKIGGGGDLHNLDMYLVSLILTVGLGICALATRGELQPASWPIWVQATLGGYLLLLAYMFTPMHPRAAAMPVELPKPQEVESALTTIREEVALAAQTGEVLFMDQRQLLTFGYVDAIPFVPEYEKKYMMDQAMAGNSDFFRAYYEDLAAGRFSLIVTEPLKINYIAEAGGTFPEENDAWVYWVSEPTLCFYEPLVTLKDVNVQLLAPREDALDCQPYLERR